MPYHSSILTSIRICNRHARDAFKAAKFVQLPGQIKCNWVAKNLQFGGQIQCNLVAKFDANMHLSVVPNKKTGSLCLNAFYAQQDVVRKAYGNYLGLCRLAVFLGREMSLKVDTVTCFIGTEKIEAKVTMPELRDFAAKLDSLASTTANG